MKDDSKKDADVKMFLDLREGRLHGPSCPITKAAWDTFEGTSSGPAQVATKQYRDNYDAIFSKNGKQPVGVA